MFLALKFLWFRRRQILGKMSITLYVLQPQEPLCCSVLLACRDLEKKPLALAVENKDVTVVTGTLTMHDSISMSWFLHILFFPLKGE